MSDGIPNPPGWYQAAFGARTTEKVLYLTYDDGPTEESTIPLLKLLATNDAKATFFVVGDMATAHADVLKQITAEGHALGDHTMDHADLVSLTVPQVRKELAGVQAIVGTALGACMRPPYGLIDTDVAQVAQELNLMPILWTGHAQDWDPPSVSEMVRRLKKATAPGAVILLHDGAGKASTLAASEIMIPWWRNQGYQLETVPACTNS